MISSYNSSINFDWNQLNEPQIYDVENLQQNESLIKLLDENDFSLESKIVKIDINALCRSGNLSELGKTIEKTYVLCNLKLIYSIPDEMDLEHGEEALFEGIVKCPSLLSLDISSVHILSKYEKKKFGICRPLFAFNKFCESLRHQKKLQELTISINNAQTVYNVLMPVTVQKQKKLSISVSDFPNEKIKSYDCGAWRVFHGIRFRVLDDDQYLQILKLVLNLPYHSDGMNCILALAPLWSLQLSITNWGKEEHDRESNIRSFAKALEKTHLWELKLFDSRNPKDNMDPSLNDKEISIIADALKVNKHLFYLFFDEGMTKNGLSVLIQGISENKNIVRLDLEVKNPKDYEKQCITLLQKNTTLRELHFYQNKKLIANSKEIEKLLKKNRDLACKQSGYKNFESFREEALSKNVFFREMNTPTNQSNSFLSKLQKTEEKDFNQEHIISAEKQSTEEKKKYLSKTFNLLLGSAKPAQPSSSSIDSVTPVSLPAIEKAPIKMRAKFDYVGADNTLLSFSQGAILTVIESHDSGWSLCKLDTPDGNGQQGYAPSSFLDSIDEPLLNLIPLGESTKSHLDKMLEWSQQPVIDPKPSDPPIMASVTAIPFSEELATIIQRISDNDPTLKEITLRNKGIGLKDVSQIANALSKNHVLEKLDLGQNTIGDHGGNALAEAIKSNRTLVELIIDHNDISQNIIDKINEKLSDNELRKSRTKSNRTLPDSDSLKDKTARRQSNLIIHNEEKEEKKEEQNFAVSTPISPLQPSKISAPLPNSISSSSSSSSADVLVNEERRPEKHSQANFLNSEKEMDEKIKTIMNTRIEEFKKMLNVFKDELQNDAKATITKLSDQIQLSLRQMTTAQEQQISALQKPFILTEAITSQDLEERLQNFQVQQAVQLEQVTHLYAEDEFNELTKLQAELQKKIELVKNQAKGDKDLEVRLKDLEEQVRPLQEEYQARLEKLHAQQYILKYKSLKQFYNRVQVKLNELFLAYMAIASGKIDLSKNKTATVMTLLGEKLDLATGGIASTLAQGFNFLYDRKRKKKITDMAEKYLISLTTSEALVELVARQLTLRYENQIRNLKVPQEDYASKKKYSSDPEGSAQTLAECAIRRIVHALKSNEIQPNSDFDQQLVDCVFTSELQHGLIYGKKHIETKKQTNKPWTVEEIFQQTGIKIIDKDGKILYYAGTKTSKYCRFADYYGYRLSTKAELDNLYRQASVDLQQTSGPNGDTAKSIQGQSNRSSDFQQDLGHHIAQRATVHVEELQIEVISLKTQMSKMEKELAELRQMVTQLIQQR